MAATLSDTQRELLAGKLFGMLATVDGRGVPYQALVWYLLRADEIIVTTQDSALKTRNIKRNGWAAIAVSQGPSYVAVRGRATVEQDPARVQPQFEQIVRHYLPADQADAWLADAAKSSAERVIIHIPFDTVGPQGR